MGARSWAEAARGLLEELERLLLLLAGIAADFGEQRLLHLLLGHLDIQTLADLGEHQAEPHASLGDLAVLGSELILRLVLVLLGQLARGALGLNLGPDGVELAVDHAQGQVEGVVLVEHVEQRTLGLEATGLGVLLAGLGADRLLQRVQRVKADTLGELVVQLDLRLGRTHLLDGRFELRRLAPKSLRRIILRKAGLDRHDLAGLDAPSAALRNPG